MKAGLPGGFLTGSPGPGELVLLFLVILLLFGPRRLPEIARAVGRAIRQLRRASDDFRDQIMRMEDRSAVEGESGKLEEYDDQVTAGPETGAEREKAAVDRPESNSPSAAGSARRSGIEAKRTAGRNMHDLAG